MTPLPLARRLLLALSLAACACACARSAEADLPAAAREAVLAQMTPYYSSQAVQQGLYDEVPEIRINRAWRGKEGAYPAGDSGQPEVWCVELTVEGTREGVPSTDSQVWIVTRNPGQTEWGAGLVMVMSSIWPYEACGLWPWPTPSATP